MLLGAIDTPLQSTYLTKVLSYLKMGVVACACDAATLEVQFWNAVGSLPVRG